MVELGLRRNGGTMTSAERERVQGFGRLEDGLRQAGDWYLWGPYVSERQWGTVREDYSADGDAWSYLPHDHARSRAYRWGEDGMAGFSDVEQRLCLGLVLWNGRDPILKERMFGLTGAQANHGEDVKEYWWYLDAVPSHAWNRWRYHYPQAAFPYDDLLAGNGRRGKLDPEYELLDTGVFDEDRYWIVEVDYAKADPTDLLMTVRVTNAGPEAATLHVLPTAWFRNTWSWEPDAPRPRLRGRTDGSVAIDHPFLGDLELLAGPGPDGVAPTALFCENETNNQRLFGVPGPTPYPKDGINDHVVGGAATVNPERHGTKAALWYRLPVGPAATVELRLRLRPDGAEPAGGGARRRLRPGRGPAPAGGRRVLRRADPAGPPGRRGGGDAPGVRRDALEQAALRLRRGPLAGGRPDPADPAGVPQWRAQRPLDQLRRVRRHVDAGQVGVPVVRRLGPGVPLRRPRPSRPGVRQVPAAAAVPGVVPASQRGPPRLRVGLRRRQPPRAGLGGARGVRHRRRPGPRLPQPGVRQAAGELHLVGEPRGRRRLQPVRRRVPGAGQHRPDRPVPSPGRWPARAVRRHRLDGLLRALHGRHRLDPEPFRPASHARPGAQVPRAFRPDPPGHGHPGGLGRRRRLLLRQARRPRRARGAGQGPVDGRRHPAAGRRGHRRGGDRSCRDGREGVRAAAPRGGRPREPGRAGPGPRRTRRSAGAPRRGRGRAPHQAARQAVRRGRVPVALRPAGPVRLPSRPPLRARGRRLPGQHRLRAGRVDHRDVRRELQLAWAHLVPAQLPADQRPRALPPVLRRRAHRRVPDGRPPAHPRPGRRRPAPAAGRPVRRRAGRSATLLRGVDRLQRDPAWSGNLVFNEYFHGDDGAGLGASHQTGWTGLVADLIRGRPSADGVYAIGDLGGVVDRARP